ncbi:hypothetical protein PBI_RYAN_59 [Arthrobacter phage Ryan]|uniref:Uncharacterized protein n=1 Tax=Arthrobacter phage Ryan TaxID=2419968 RepID=A0A3G2KJI7_9CAUD|nr:hypothetical protein QEO75_gp50 [Arthrobacter phage Ryan]AYN59049.1 hypothetical protein PBI_RYAN_59 [Arthrobacter phage Ryan]
MSDAEYVYEVRSDRPMVAFHGIGNVAVLTFSSNGYGITQRDQVVRVASNGAATGAGTFTVELKERVNKTPDHNHITREVRPRGNCPACDGYWAQVDAPRPPGPPNPPSHPFHQPFG